MTNVEQNVALIRSRGLSAPKVAIVLGSGLGEFSARVDHAVAIPYRELEGFPLPVVSGHSGSLVLGSIGGTPVAVLSGRGHYYEHGRPDVMRPALETLKTLGATAVILTNAAGSVRHEIAPGSVMLIADHINFGNLNPLVGEASEARFVGMSEAYDAGLRHAALEAAKAQGIELIQGVYVWFCGPSFQTPAEIRAAGILGGDAVGMSTVPEVILARFLGLKVLAFSVITNFAAGMASGELSHAETKEIAPIGGAKLAGILTHLLSTWPK